MKNLYINRLLYIVVIMSISLWAEPSVYGFDDEYIEDSPNISVDRDKIAKDNSDVIYEQSDIDIVSPPVVTNITTIDSLKEKIDEQSERIDGLITIIDGLSKSIKEIKDTSEVDDNYDKDIEDDKANKDVVVDKPIYVEPIVDNNSVIPTPKSTPIPKSTTTSISKPTVTPKPKVKSNNLIFSEGVTSFLSKDYTKAKKSFTLTESRGYKVGTSNYYLGEISYYTKDYENAIFHYKKSAGISDKTSYIDTLLLHTGISFENSGKKKKAKAFYENIIANYPKNKTAKIAKDKLRNM